MNDKPVNKVHPKDHILGRLQYQLEWVHNLYPDVAEKNGTEWLKMSVENLGIFYDFVVKQRGYAPEPSEVDLEVNI